MSESNWSGSQVHPQHHYNAGNINIVYNTYNAGGGISPARTPEPQPDSDADDERELGPQYSQLPSLQPFLSAQPLSNRYTEIQIGLPFYQGFRPEVPPCDNYSTRHKNGQHPIVYTCFECIPFKARHLCRRCAEKELADDESFHKPNHKVRKWQPTWTWDVSKGFRTPLPSKDMEEFVKDELYDDLRAAVFESSRYYDDRAIRVVVPAPPGLCRVIIKFEVEHYESAKRERDIVDQLKGLFSSDDKEIIGNIGASAYPSTLQLPLRPRDPHSEPQDPPKKGELKLSDNIDLKRGDDFSKTRNLEVYATAEEHGAIEVVLQDEYYGSEKYRSRPFFWKLKSISITHVPPLAPSFASLAQMEQYRRRRVNELRQSGEQSGQDFKDRYDATMQRAEDYQAWRESVEKREGRNRERASIPQITEEPRPSSMPPTSHFDASLPLLLANTIGGRGNAVSNNQRQHLSPPRDNRGRARLSPLDAVQGVRHGYPGRSVSPNWRATNPVQHARYGQSGTSPGRVHGGSPLRTIASPTRAGGLPVRPTTAPGRSNPTRRLAPSPRPKKPLRIRR